MTDQERIASLEARVSPGSPNESTTPSTSQGDSLRHTTRSVDCRQKEEPGMTDKHTPGPWVAVPHSGTVHDSQGRFIADVRDPGDYLHLTDITEANAEFIVRAVNSHALMLEALREIMTAYAETAGHSGLPLADTDAWHKARAAIAAATGEDA